MSDISNFDIEKVARLARVELNETEKQKFTHDLGDILNFVNELQAAETQAVAPISQISNLANIARTDEVTNENEREKMLQNAPEQKDGFVKVKKIFE